MQFRPVAKGDIMGIKGTYTTKGKEADMWMDCTQFLPLPKEI